MKESLLGNFHWIIILFTAYNLFVLYEEKVLEIENAKALVSAEQRKIDVNEKKLAEIEKFKKNLEASKERVNEVIKQIEKVQKQLPTDVNDTQVQQLMGGISNDLKIKNPRAIPSTETPNGFYFQKEYEFHARGTFLQFLVFFENLSKAERILNVKELVMARNSEKKQGRYQVLDLMAKVESFRYNVNHRESDGLKEIEANYGN